MIRLKEPHLPARVNKVTTGSTPSLAFRLRRCQFLEPLFGVREHFAAALGERIDCRLHPLPSPLDPWNEDNRRPVASVDNVQ